ncbi:MAG: DUF2634 domain-containing protein [Oscillospiraceae bacterium]|nr:DUF2634 domain-containing protein [Oscillospiraceae bacterium]
MIPNVSVSAYAAYDGERDYTLKDGRMGPISQGRETLPGWITVALTTERGAYPIFSKEFGIPLSGADDRSLERAVRSALMRDERIRSVDEVKILRERGEVSVRLNVQTVYGVCETETKLNV